MKLVVFAFVSLLAFAAQAQFIEHEERDKRYLVPLSPDVTTPHKVGLFTHMAEVSPSCRVAKSSVPVPLQRCQHRLNFPHFGRSKFPHLLWPGDQPRSDSRTSLGGRPGRLLTG